MMSYLQVLPAQTTAPSSAAISSSVDDSRISKSALVIIVVLAGVASILLGALIVAGCKLAGKRSVVTTRAGPLEADVV